MIVAGDVAVSSVFEGGWGCKDYGPRLTASVECEQQAVSSEKKTARVN